MSSRYHADFPSDPSELYAVEIPIFENPKARYSDALNRIESPRPLTFDELDELDARDAEIVRAIFGE